MNVMPGSSRDSHVIEIAEVRPAFAMGDFESCRQSVTGCSIPNGFSLEAT
jgi:hypothetical protein